MSIATAAPLSAHPLNTAGWGGGRTFKPACQLAYDVFGPMFHLGQDQWTRKLRGVDLPAGVTSDVAIEWHSVRLAAATMFPALISDRWMLRQDGRELGFPEMRSPAGSAAGNLPMHTLRFGYFLSDCSHERSGTVECIRGSHRTMRNTCEALG